MGLDSAHRFLGLTVGSCGAGCGGKEIIVRGEEPDGAIDVEEPLVPAAGEADLRLEGPAIVSDIDETPSVVLAGFGGYGDACADD